MVQILPSKTNIGSQLGLGLGTGLQQGLERSNQYNFQRGNLLKALQGVKGLGQQPGANAFDLATGLMEATAGIPGAEKYVGQLFPILLQQLALKQEGPGAQGGGMLGAQEPSGMGVSGGQQTASLQPPPASEEPSRQFEEMLASGQISKPSYFDPTAGQKEPIYSPSQLEGFDIQDAKRGGPPVLGPIARQHNQDVLSASESKLKTTENTQRLSNIVQEENEKFAQYVSQRAPQMPEDDKRIFLSAANTPQAMDAKNMQDRYKVAEDITNRVHSAVAKLEDAYPRGIGSPESVQKYMDELRPQVDLMVKYGQRDKAKAILTDNLSFGNAEAEEIINPLKPSQKKILSDFPKITGWDAGISPAEVFESHPEAEFGYESPEQKAYGQKVNKNAEQRKKDLDKYTPRIRAAIRPGTPTTPGTSLDVVRKYAMDKGMQWWEFRDILQKMVADGDLHLDVYQMQELPDLQRAPHKGLADVLFDRR